MNVRRISMAAVAATALVLRVAPVAAHHSAASAYDTTKKVETQGTITKLLLRNPHSWVFLEGTDEKGQKVEWQIELGAWSGMVEQGWTKEMLAPGTVVKVSGNPSKAAGSHGMTSAKFFKPDGSPLGPNRGQYDAG
jgi:Family of unknown function (DUF6152)